MATNWCKPLAVWRQLFEKWIKLPEPQALLDAAIFFDFRVVAGNLSLKSLDEIISTAKSERRFLSHMLNGAMAFKPPLGFFNRLRSEHGKIDLKMGGIAPLVALAREAVADAGGHDARAKGQQRDDDDQPRRTEGTPRLRLRRPDCLKDTCAHQPDAPASAVPGVRDKSSGLMCGQETG